MRKVMPSRFASRPQYSMANVRKHPAATARAGDAYHFALQVRGALDFWRRHDVADKLINYAGNKYQIGALRGRAKHSAGAGALVQLRFACRETGHPEGPAADMSNSHLQ